MKDIEKKDNVPEITEEPELVEDEELEDDEVSIITLVDDEGNESDFELLDVIDYKGNDYAVLCSVEEGDEAGEAAILQLIDTPDDEDSPDFVTPKTEEEITAVYEIFKEKYKDIIEFED